MDNVGIPCRSLSLPIPIPQVETQDKSKYPTDETLPAPSKTNPRNSRRLYLVFRVKTTLIDRCQVESSTCLRLSSPKPNRTRHNWLINSSSFLQQSCSHSIR